ncbi:serine/threonine-protein kinase [Nocardia sp. CA-120079]|uniref:serine/threonine-protein kinase n=1 Tax=Nocardia sp. CA-120079 TaxID=3239974 RepID=UPI003D961C3B
MGVVYLARHPRLDRSVALKVIGGALADDPRVRTRFERESALAASLDHPNIVHVYDRSDKDAETLWISMKYIAGGDTVDLLARSGGRLRVDHAVRLIGDIARALDHAHAHGIVHRDVKPANILVDRSENGLERAVLTDFGIARAFSDTQTLSAITATFAYAAPERFGTEPVDRRADLYSLACTLYELLTGQTPFPRSDQAAVIAAHLHEPPPRPTDLVPGVPPGVDEVIATAMAKHPEDRYPDCGTFAAAANQVLTEAWRPTEVNAVHNIESNPHQSAMNPSSPPPSAVGKATSRTSWSRLPVWLAYLIAVVTTFMIELATGAVTTLQLGVWLRWMVATTILEGAAFGSILFLARPRTYAIVPASVVGVLITVIAADWAMSVGYFKFYFTYLTVAWWLPWLLLLPTTGMLSWLRVRLVRKPNSNR